MIYDAALKMKGIQLLVEQLGDIETEKFIAMLRQEPFDYTQWQANLWKGLAVEEISCKAMEYFSEKK